jgi:hypothetical protein
MTDNLPNDDALLMMMVNAARKEQALGHDGWMKEPPEWATACERLFRRLLVVRNADGFVLPTKTGFAMVEGGTVETGAVGGGDWPKARAPK